MRVNIYENKERERQKKIFIALLFSMIMIFSAFTLYENTSTSSVTNTNQQSIPIQSYNAYGESVSFVDNQPVISFSPNPLSTHYPVSWDILSVNTGGIHNTNSATPLVSTNNTLIVNQFTHYRTSRINDTTQNSAQLIQCSNTTQSASVFFFHHYTMSASLAWKNKHPYNQTYMIDFTMITPYSNNYYVGGDNGFHNMTMNNNTGIIPASCVNLQVGGMDLYWMADASLFHGGMIEQKDHHDIVVIPFGTVTLQSNETYTIDPSIEPLPKANNQGLDDSQTSGPEFVYCVINQSPSTCFATNSSSSSVCICTDLLSSYESKSVNVGFFERETDGVHILLGNQTAKLYVSNYFHAYLNTTGSFSGFGIATGSCSLWICKDKLGHSFCEYDNLSSGYAYPDHQADPSAGDVLNSDGKIMADIGGGVLGKSPPVSADIESYRDICLYQSFLSRCNAMGAKSRSVDFTYESNNKGIRDQCTKYVLRNVSCRTTSCDYTPLQILLISTLVPIVIATATIVGIYYLIGEGLMAAIGSSIATIVFAVGISLYQYTFDPDHKVIENKADCNGLFCCSDVANKSCPNEPYNYFYTGCGNVSNFFGQKVRTYIGKQSTTPPAVVEQFKYSDSFTLFNTTLTGNLCEEQQTYSGTLISPVYIYYTAG